LFEIASFETGKCEALASERALRTCFLSVLANREQHDVAVPDKRELLHCANEKGENNVADNKILGLVK